VVAVAPGAIAIIVLVSWSEQTDKAHDRPAIVDAQHLRGPWHGPVPVRDTLEKDLVRHLLLIRRCQKVSRSHW
jgi:hypothetical protein